MFVDVKRRFSALVVTFSCLAGCGGPGYEKPDTAPVSGTVQFKGQPIADGEIILQPVGGRAAHGEIENGQIVNVYTYEPGDGAPVGDLQVAVFATEPDTSDPSGMGVKSLIPEKYNDAAKSGLTAKVETGQENKLELTLTE